MALADRPIAGKVCPRCPEKGIQPASAFSPNGARRDGLQSYCKRCTRAYQADYHAKNPANGKRWSKAFRDRLRAEMFDAYGHECACCGEAERTFLCLDHVAGVVPPEQRDAAGKRLAGDKILAALRRQGWPTGYRILCANCNLAWALLGTCPHQATLRVVA
jgi:hypothetical protein